MTSLKKRGPIRQFSFQCNSPKTPERRRSLKKQFSEDLVEISSAHDIETSSSIRVSLSAKGTKPVENAPAVKLAWSNITENDKTENVPSSKGFIEGKQRISNIMPNKITRQQSLDKSIIFNSRHVMNKSVKQNKPEVKQNLNIFLGNDAKEVKDEELSDSSYSSVDNQSHVTADSNFRRPKLILPLNPDITNNDNMKSVFQKRIRKMTKQKSLFVDNCYSPTRSETCSTIVVPVISNKQRDHKIHRQSSVDIDISKRKGHDEVLETKSDLSRPSTAASRREVFQKRTSSATSTSSTSKDKKDNSFRPPLVRTSSVPISADPPKPKFVASKRRVKTAKAKVRIGKSNDGTTDDDDQPTNQKHWLRRSASVNGGEVETMVSLVSPSGSENEEDLQEEKETLKCEEQAAKTSVAKQEPQQVSEQRSFSLRKTVKSVSFQQSTIHAIRSFSASFPARRGSVATSLFLNNSTITQMVQMHKSHEKRAPVNTIDDEERVPKRRLIRTKSAPLQRSIDDDTTDGSATKENSSGRTNIQANCENDTETQISSTSTSKTINCEVSESEDGTQQDSANSATPPFENTKERQCWDMYCKMSEKGVTISFDTILRGMLTPTEYRLRSKAPSVVPEDNCEIAEN